MVTNNFEVLKLVIATNRKTMTLSTLLSLLALVLLMVREPVVSYASHTDTMLTSSIQVRGNLNGHLFLFTKQLDDTLTVVFEAMQGEASLRPIQLSDNDTDISLTLSDVGSGDSLMPSDKSRDLPLVYDVLHHYAYIAVGSTIVIVNLNTSNDPHLTYETLQVAHPPSSLKASTFQGDTYLMVAYTTPTNRGFVHRFRRFKVGWRMYGGLQLVTTPAWFSVDRVTDMVLYKARDSLSDYSTLWVGVAQDWSMFAVNLIDGTTQSYEVPQPCDHVERLVVSQHKQRMLVQCREATVFFDAKKKEFYAIWPEALGTVYISRSGQYGAVVSPSQSRSVTFLKIHNNDFQSVSVNVSGEVTNVTMVDVSSTHHMFCYVEQLNETFSVRCINIELVFRNASSDLFTSTLVESQALDQLNCPSLYSRHNLLAVQLTVCIEDSCHPLVRLFDLTTLTNTHNVTGVEPSLLVYKAIPFHPPTLPPMTSDTPTTSGHTLSTTSNGHTPSLTPSGHIPSPEDTLETTPTTPWVTTAGTDMPSSNRELYQQCSRELEQSMASYQQLLWVAIVIGALFCLALLVTVLLVTALVCALSRAGGKQTVDLTQERYTSKPPAYGDSDPTCSHQI